MSFENATIEQFIEEIGTKVEGFQEAHKMILKELLLFGVSNSQTLTQRDLAFDTLAMLYQRTEGFDFLNTPGPINQIRESYFPKLKISSIYRLISNSLNDVLKYYPTHIFQKGTWKEVDYQ